MVDNYDSGRLTPTEELVLEVLQARCRGGEQIFTFAARHKPTLKKLRARGIIDFKGAVVENFLSAWFTTAGAEEFLTGTYTYPLVSQLQSDLRDAEGEITRLKRNIS